MMDTATASEPSSGSNSTSDKSTTLTDSDTSTGSSDSSGTMGSSSTGDTADDTSTSSPTSGDTNTNTNTNTNTDTNSSDNSCGDGVIQGNEECDFNNEEDAASCSEYCHTKPIGINLVSNGEWTSWAPEQPADIITTVTKFCDTGVMIRFSADDDSDNSSVPCNPSFGCSNLPVDTELQISTGEDSATGVASNCIKTGESWNQNCPPGHIIIGTHVGASPSLVHRLGFRCRPIKVIEDPNNGFSIDLSGPIIEMGPNGDDDPNLLSDTIIDCLPNMVVIGGEIPDPKLFTNIPAMRLQCTQLELVFP